MSRNHPSNQILELLVMPTPSQTIGPSGAAVLALMLLGCASQELPKSTGPGPIKTSLECPLQPNELVPAVTVPKEALDGFAECVSRYGASQEHTQAASWIRDWYTASSCLHRCDSEGIDSLAHQSMWQGLRYIVAATLPEADQLEAGCSETRRKLLVALDESMNHFAGWRAVSATQCIAAKRAMATEARMLKAQEYRDRLVRQISAFTNKSIRG